MSKVRSLVGCMALTAIGINAIAFYGSDAKSPGDRIGPSEMAAVYGEGIPGTYCKVLTGKCTAGTVAGCGLPALGRCASQGNVCSTCKGAAHENCALNGTITCVQLPNKTCCSPNTCNYVGATYSTPNGSCSCNLAGAVAGMLTDC